ncbi:MAG: sialidase domain-containing protein [Clostridium sp.]
MNRKKIISMIIAATLISNCGGSFVMANTLDENLNNIASKFAMPIVEERIPQSQMTATATSEHITEKAGMAIDGNVNTMWHTPWNEVATMPQSFNLSLGEEYDVSTISVTPRQSGANGIISKYEIYSGDVLIASGNWGSDTTTKTVKFEEPVKTDNIEIRAIQASGGFVSIAEVNVYHKISTANYLVEYNNLRISGGNGGSKSEDISKIKDLQQGTIVARFDSKATGLQSIFSVSNNTKANGHFHLYIADGKVGYEIRYDNGTTSNNLSTGSANVELNVGINTIAFRVEKNVGYSIFLNGVKVLNTNVAETKFLSDLFELNAMDIGKVDRIDGSNEYLFTGDVDFIQVYGQALSDNYLQEKTAETVLSNLPLPEGVVKTDPIDVYVPGELGSSNFRIPSMITTKNGTILSAIDVRKGGGHDSPNNIDTGVKRSTDGGSTWDEGQIILDYPDAASGIDASMLQDKESGKIFLLVDAFPQGRGAFQALRGSGFKDIEVDGKVEKGMILQNSSNMEYYATSIIEANNVEGVEKQLEVVVNAAGERTNYRVDSNNNLYTVNESLDATKIGNTFGDICELKAFGTSYLALISSDDDGITWSEPEIVSGQFKKEWMSFLGTGPGNGIQINNGDHAGRLIFPVYYLNKNQKQSSAAIYSDDGGATWQLGESVNDGRLLNGNTIHSSEITGASREEMTEAQVVEMPEDGQLKMFMRNPSVGNPAIATSFDGGITWESVVEYETDLKEPYCQLSIINYSQKIDGKDAVIFSNPDSGSRAEGTVQIGLINETGVDNNGNKIYDFEWPYKKLVKPGYFAYSSLAELPNGEIGLFYEGTGSSEMSFIKMNVDYLKADLIGGSPGATVKNVKVVDIAESYNVGDEVKVQVTFDQTVSLMGNKNLTVIIGEKEIELSMIENKDGKEMIFTGIIPEGIENGVYNTSLKSTTGLDITNVNGKVSSIIENIDLEQSIKIGADEAEVLNGKTLINIPENIIVEDKFNVTLGVGNIKEDLEAYSSEFIMTYNAEVFDFNEITSAKEGIYVSGSKIKDGEVRVIAASLGLPIGSVSDIANISLIAKKECVDETLAVTLSQVADGEGVIHELELGDKKVTVNAKVQVPDEDIVVSKPQKINVTDKNSNSISIAWESPKSTIGLTNYIIYKDGKVLEKVSAETTEYVLDNLKANTIYGIKVVAEYLNGEVSKPISVNGRTEKAN